MKTAHEIFWECINKIKKEVRERERIVFDPKTGIQKCFLDGKLIWVKKVRTDL